MMAVCWSLVVVVVLFTLTPSASADALSRCSPQLPRTRYLKASDWGKCYEFHLEERSWRNANNICATKGGHLVTIREERIQIFLLNALSELRWPRNGLWIGATDKEKEMEWVWVTGERVRNGYSRWASGQPSCGLLLCFEDCAVMRWKEGGKWHDYRCNWLEDYSFICEYDMLPKPTTTTTTTTTTASSLPESTTLPEVVTANATSILLVPSSKVLESEYLLHEHGGDERNKNKIEEKGEKNDTLASMLPPAVMLDGTNGARAEQVQESVSSSQPGLGSGAVAFLVIAILVILGAGLCFMLVVMRRRHRKLIREDDKGISYENPYYESSATDKGSGDGHSDDADTIGETDDEDAVACCDGGGTAVGFIASASSRKHTEMKQPPPRHSRPRLVMNDYCTPPTLANNTTKSLERSRNHPENNLTTKEDNQRDSLLMPKEASAAYYDELHSSYANTHLNYDIPRASSEPWYRNDDHDNHDMPPFTDEMYYNNYNENIYESVDNLTALGEQQRDTQADEADAGNYRKDEENHYVPFLLDAPKVVSSE